MRTTKLAPGTVLAERYQIIGFVNEGGMGALYRARHLHVDRQVAVKVLLTGIGDSEAAHKRFVQEAKIAGSLSHTNVVPVYDFGTTPDDLPFLVMDFLEGDTLADAIKDRSLNQKQVLDVVLQICDGLKHAHAKGLIHRDLKPSNVMLVDESGKMLAKVMDFGIAKKVDDDAQQLTKTGEVFGSPFYMSPEQCRGMVLDGRSDIYAVGCILFELLSGRVPLRGDNTLQTISKHLTEPPPALSSYCKVSPELEAIVQKCLEKDPDRRYQSIDQLSIALRKLLDGKLGSAETVSPAETDGTVKIQTGPRAEAQVNSPVSTTQTIPPQENKSSMAPAAIAIAAIIGIGCAFGIPYLLKKDESGLPPVNVSVKDQSTTESRKLSTSEAANPSTTIVATATGAGTGTETTTETATSTGSNQVTMTSTSTNTTHSGTASNTVSDTTSGDKTITGVDDGAKVPKSAATSTDAKTTSKSATEPATPKPADENQTPTSKTGKPDSGKETKPAIAMKDTAKPAASNPATTTPQPKAEPAKKTAEPSEEERLLAQAKESMRAAKEKLDGLIGINVTWNVDWASFDKPALERFGYYGAEKVKDAIEEIAQDKIGKESLRGKIKKITFKNSRQPSTKQVSFHDGILELQASWSTDDWDNVPNVRDIVHTIENGL